MVRIPTPYGEIVRFARKTRQLAKPPIGFAKDHEWTEDQRLRAACCEEPIGVVGRLWHVRHRLWTEKPTLEMLREEEEEEEET